MKLTLFYADNESDLASAGKLVQSRYSQDFNVNLDELKGKYQTDARQDVIVIKDEYGSVVGTCSMMFPGRDGYSSEALFGVNMRHEIPGGGLLSMVEVGRVAKNDHLKDGDLIMKALMLAVAEYLIHRSMAGWVATVKTPMLRYLRKAGLTQLHIFEKFPDSDFIIPSAVLPYYRDVHHFMTTTEATVAAFQKYFHLIHGGTVSSRLAVQPPNSAPAGAMPI